MTYDAAWRRTSAQRRLVLEFVLVRHGATEWNATGRFAGRSDIPLSERGRAQADALASAFASLPINALISSDLVRATQTAHAISLATGIPIRLDPRLREFDFGEWEGRTWRQILAQNPSLADHHAHAARLYAPPGGERFEEVCERVAAVLTACSEGCGERVVLLAHAGVIHAALGVLLGPTFEAMQASIAPGSLTRVWTENGDARLITLSDVPNEN